ncbi:MAG: asparagine synthase (glutamine-hydrolyzing) [Phycisphaerales bacterium]|nr:asparagine synthase (glutamine-hydrolyzing) [Phycisphaerales bacterium]
MCGIAGILNLRPAAPPVRAAELELMAAKLAHRGPDGSGVYVDPQGRCGLAFRRLAIIDLVSGAQPLANESGRIWVAFNGEIYNFRALRSDLERVGHHFATQSDTEVLVHLYEQYGADGCRQLAGMFAFACWDEERGRLILVRDRFGKKPLHYAVHDSRLYFASELKAILALPGMPRRLAPQALHEYLIYQYVPAPHAIYAGFRKLPPGHLLEIEPVTTSRAAATPRIDDLTPRAYWCLDPAPFHGSYAEALDQLNVLLRRAVERRLVADVPLGAFLSGGLDSSIVVALMVQLGVRPLRTFSMGFTDPQYDETRFARRVAAHFGTEHHEHLVVPEAHTILAQLAWHYDEPFADSSAIPTYYVSHWTRQHVTVALTGDGGDELFAGYDRYRAAALAERFDLVPGAVRRVLAALAGWLPHAQPRSWGHRTYRFAQALAAPPADRYLSWVNVFPPALLATGYRPEFAATLALDAPLDWFRGLYEAAPGPAANRAIRTDFASYLPFDLLTKVDIASMACGLECRAPFLDHELASFAAALPLAWRLKGGGKHILRDWAADKLPPAVLRRPKMGFGVPVGRWFRAELRDTLRTHLLARDGLSMRIFRPEWLAQLVEGHLSGRANYEHALWALLMLEYWQRQWAPLDLADLP